MKRAILLMNMGGPANEAEVDMFLNNMFNDKHIINLPQPSRKLLAMFIAFTRSKEAKRNYNKIGGKSPIVHYTQALMNALQTRVDATIFMVMRYTPPFAKDVMASLKGYDEIYAIPLYPHYSSTTTASSVEALMQALQKEGVHAPLKTVSHYYKHPLFIQSVIARITETLGHNSPSEFELIFSAHGLPQKVIDKGDLYQRHIKYSLFYLRKALMQAGIAFHKTHLAYQSKVGPMQWTTPYLEETLKKVRTKRVIIYPLAFTIDNSETAYELDIEYREYAKTLQIEEYRVAKAPNEHPLFAQCIASLYQELKQS